MAGCYVSLRADVWVGRSLLGGDEEKVAHAGLLGLGVLCFVLMGPEKIMADEVAHETEGAWSLLIYNLLVGRRLLLAGETRGET